jgi:hypothetical protein
VSRGRALWRPASWIICWVLLSLAGCTLFQPEEPVDFSVSQSTGVAPLPVEFTPIVGSDVTAYYWDFGDGATSAEPSPVHVYRDRGTYDVFLAVTLADGSTGSTKKKDLIDVETISQKEDRLTPLYWLDTDTGTIHWGDRAGMFSDDIISYVYGGQDLAVAGGYIFWTTENVLYRANLDGTGKTSIAENQLGLHSVSVDHLAEKVYWTCLPAPSLRYTYWEGSIKRADFDGSAVETLRTYDPRLHANAHWIRCDGNGERYYYSTSDDTVSGPRQFDLNSLSEEAFSFYWAYVHDPAPHKTLGALGFVCSMALDVSDLPAHYVYWTNGSEIMRCKIDGSGRTKVLGELTGAWGIAVDLIEGKMYWSDNNGIHRAELDGSQAEVIYPGARADILILPR